MKIHLEFDSYKELVDFCNQMSPQPEVVKTPKKTPKKTTAPTEPAATPTTTEPAVPSEDTPDYAAIRKEILAHVQNTYNDSNIQELANHLKAVGFGKISDIPDDKLGEFWKLLKGE